MDLFDFFSEVIIPLRKGLEVAAISQGLPAMDSYRMAAVAEYKDRFKILLTSPAFYTLVQQGVTYISLGNILGSETAALYFMALGKYYGFCDLVLPKDLGLYDDEADIAASDGSVVLIERTDA